MALTKKFLENMGLNEEQIEAIMEGHTATVEGLKADGARYKADAEKLADVQEELDSLKAAGVENWKEKHDAVLREFNATKAFDEKKAAYREFLTIEGCNPKLIDMVVRGSTELINSIELGDGRIQNIASVSAAFRSEWSDLLGNTKPGAVPGNQTRESILAIQDRGERLAAIQNHPHLFND